MKFVRRATSAPLDYVHEGSNVVDNDWQQVDLINASDTGYVLVSSIAHRTSKKMFDLILRRH